MSDGTAAFVQPDPVELASGVRLWDSMVYAAEAGYRPQFLDLLVPASERPAPLVVWIHGGGWLFGSRRRQAPNLHRHRVIEGIVEAGFAVAKIDYRLVREAPQPAAVHDVRAAVRWLRAHADRFGIDAGKVVLWGESAGAHLALLAGWLPPLHGGVGERGVGEFGPGSASPQSEAVQAVVDWYGPADLEALAGPVAGTSDEIVASANDPISLLASDPVWNLRDLSPLTHVAAGLPPTFIAHGLHDEQIPVEQSRVLQRALEGAGVATELLEVPGGHVFDGALSLPLVLTKSLEFLRREVLGGAPTAVEPETAAMEDRLNASRIAPILNCPDGSLRSGPDARARGVLARERFYPPQFFEVAEVSDGAVDGPNGPIPLRFQRPLADADTTLVYIHGGGWIIGDLDSHEANASRLAAHLPAHVVQVDYRLAPEHRFPAGYEDVAAAVRWVAANIDRFGGDASRLVLAGDSAGGNLAAAAAAALLDEGLEMAALLLIYPGADCRGTDPALAEAYLGPGRTPEQEADPRVSPLLAPNLADFPPTVIGSGTNDFLYQDNVRFAEALNAAGVPVVMRSFAGLTHGFFSYGNVSARADAAAALMVEDLRAVLALKTAAAARP